MSENPILELVRLTITYGKRAVVQEAELAVARGEVHALLGRNGSGKSSLVRCLLGQQLPQSGTARLFGLDVLTHRAALMAKVGVTPEEPNVPPHWSAKVLANYCKPLYPIWKGQTFFERLGRWGIDTSCAFGQLSRGQQSLVHLALALATEPELLILDDPTLGLDAVARRTVLEEVIEELAERPITVLLTSHDFDCIESLATHVCLLHEGRLHAKENLEELRTRCRLITFTRPDGMNLDEALQPLEPLAIRTLGRAVEALVGRFDQDKCRALTKICGDSSFDVSSPSLESIFIALTTRGN